MRARHFTSCGKVSLVITLTLEPPKSGAGQAIKGLLRCCPKETGHLERNKSISESVKVTGEEKSKLINGISCDT